MAPPYWKAGGTYRIDVKRKEEIRTVILRLGRNLPGNWFRGQGKESLVLALISILYLILAAVVGFNIG
jgi:hypothetical protein